MNYKERKRLAGFVALGGVTLAVIIIFSAQRTGNKNGAFIGIGVFAAACIATVILDVTNAKSRDGSKSGRSKYDPLLLDERTKLHPEVQRLLQYTEVQKAFFNPAYLSSAEAQNDPNVRELLAVFDQMLQSGDYSPNQSAVSPYSQTQKRKPRHVIGALVALVGMALLIAPFALMFIVSATDSPNSAAELSSAIFIAIPAGPVLIIVGSIVGRR